MRDELRQRNALDQEIEYRARKLCKWAGFDPDEVIDSEFGEITRMSDPWHDLEAIAEVARDCAADTIERLTAERDEALVALRELAAMPEGGEVYWRIRQLNALADKARSILAKHERKEP